MKSLFFVVTLMCMCLAGYAHEAPILDYIKDKNPRLEVHKTEDGIHKHGWCYDANGGNQNGWFEDHWEADELIRSTPPPVVDPDPVIEPPDEDNGGVQTSAPTEYSPVPEPEPVSAPVSVPPVAAVVVSASKAPPANIVLTQVMFHDWGASSGGNLPQWFELHNRGGDGNLEGYTLTFSVKTRFFGVYEEKVIVLKDFPLKAGETMIVTRRRVGHFLGHLYGHSQGVEHVYIDEDIPNLKNRWTLTDPSGKVVYRRDARWNWGWGKHIERNRAAFDVMPSEPYTGEEPIYYGSHCDAGNPPGFHEDIPPKAPQVRWKRIGTWGDLKVW